MFFMHVSIENPWIFKQNFVKLDTRFVLSNNTVGIKYNSTCNTFLSISATHYEVNYPLFHYKISHACSSFNTKCIVVLGKSWKTSYWEIFKRIIPLIRSEFNSLWFSLWLGIYRTLKSLSVFVLFAFECFEVNVWHVRWRKTYSLWLFYKLWTCKSGYLAHFSDREEVGYGAPKLNFMFD